MAKVKRAWRKFLLLDEPADLQAMLAQSAQKSKEVEIMMRRVNERCNHAADRS